VPRTEFGARTFLCLREFKVELADLVMQIPQSAIRTYVGAGYLAARVTVLDGPSMFLQRIQPATKLLPILLMAPAVGWWGWSSAGTGQPTAAMTVAQPAQGRVEGGGDVLSLGAAATGTIAELLVSPGAHVEAGQHLVRIECGQIEHELEESKAALAAFEAAYLRTLHGPRPEEISVGIANVNLAEARLQEAQKSLDRTHQLREGFTVTRVQIDQAERDARMDAAMLDEVRAKLALLKAGSREEDITETRSRRDAAKRRVEEVSALLGYCSVDAPMAGLVLSTNVTPGQLVSTTVPVTLLTIVDDSTRRVRAYVDEAEAERLCVGQQAHMTEQGAAGPQIDGVVEAVGGALVDNPFAENSSRQFRQVMISMPHDQQQNPIGLRVSVQFSPCAPRQGGPDK
jgi:HlyD family secretion protein